MNTYNPEASDISHVSKTLGDKDERFNRLIEIGATLFQPTITLGKISIEEYTVINARNPFDNKLLIVLRDKQNNSKIVHWKSIKYNYEMECYFSRKEDALYIASEYLKKLILNNEKLISEISESQ